MGVKIVEREMHGGSKGGDRVVVSNEGRGRGFYAFRWEAEQHKIFEGNGKVVWGSAGLYI